jgi:hypothetical protein
VLYDARTGSEKLRLPFSSISAAATDLDGKRLALAFPHGGIEKLIVWDVETGKELKEISHPATLKDIAAIQFLPDKGRLATIAGNKASLFIGVSFYTEQAGFIWDLASAKAVSRIPAGEDRAKEYAETLTEEDKPYIAHGVLSADGRRMGATVFPSRLVYWGVRQELAPKDAVVWDLTRPIPEEVFRRPGAEIKGLSHDGSVALLNASGALIAIKLDVDDLLETACRRVTRNLDRKEWSAYFGADNYRLTCSNLPGAR